MDNSFFLGFFSGLLSFTAILLYAHWADIQTLRNIRSIRNNNLIMRKTLEFYAKKSHYNFYSKDTWTTTNIELDEGKTARDTLEIVGAWTN